VHHRLGGIATYRLNGLRKGDENSACAMVEYGTFTLHTNTHFQLAGNTNTYLLKTKSTVNVKHVMKT